MNNKVHVLQGIVIRSKMQKSIVVSINRIVKHSMYKKFINRTTKIYVHDTNNISNVGDIVEITECRPISKTKCWKLTSIIKKYNSS
ncbi:30S ribosomal subunit protein S17 [Candidatus Blochmanniella floridana]|uniref:Small ribosomal subunit protein uS17 n=1 Tax=Blochmanniella floridana TaxID=203907 RepID=RS17_BLOFL|nr:RecName: Full=Small ribosomal subunit protein uS17; AltName: Full=30S ribosomal protein S17 [Candidatus Blochmannia floridanus]CAD83715.1 30S ribosomal subunit protein S17 [Candidatus Blochmannia floridanus]